MDDLIDLRGTFARSEALTAALDTLYASAVGVHSVKVARSLNTALLGIGRELVRVLYSKDGTYRQDPALNIPLLPEFAAAAAALGTVPAGVLRTELVRARNRLDRALDNAAALAQAAL
jgi:hypothetical protein